MDHRFKDLKGSHYHSFELNWDESKNAMLRSNLPIAVPIPDPSDYDNLLHLVRKEFRIDNIQLLLPPPWVPKLI